MNTKGKVLISIGVIAVVGVGYYLYNKYYRKPKNSSTSEGEVSSEEKVSWRFLDNHWGANEINKLGFIGTQKPPFKVGDLINVEQSSGAKHSQYNGNSSVSAITKVGFKWVVSIPKTYRGSSPINAGVITNII